MAQVDVSVNGQSYRIACEDGQEDRLVDLATMVDEKVLELVNQIGQVGSNRLLVMAALIIADELVDLKNEAGSLQEQKDNTNQQDTVLALQEITKRMSSWANMVAYKAVLEGAIDPKETDITSPSFDKNMRNIEKINKVIDFATFLKDKEK